MMMLDLFYRGSISVSGPEEAKVLKDIWKVFHIDSVRLDSLDVISEVVLNNSKYNPNSPTHINTHENILANIKTEIVEEVDMLIDLKSGLEVECSDCKERFKEEEDLLRHMDHIHGTPRSMYDRIKYKRAKNSEESSSHPKSKKGKGKGKKSIESKPLRKDNEMNEDDASAQDSPKKSEPEPNLDETSRNSIDELITSQDSVDESSMDVETPKNSESEDKKKGKKSPNGHVNYTSAKVDINTNCTEKQIEEKGNIESKDNKLSVRKSGQKHSENNRKESDEIDLKVDEKEKNEKKRDEKKKEDKKKETNVDENHIEENGLEENKRETRRNDSRMDTRKGGKRREENISEKRTIESVEKSIDEPSPKRTRRELKEKTPEKAPEPEPESEEEEEESWEDIQCLYCDQDVPVFRNKPGQNRKKYQIHLLTHFLDQQYDEIPEGLRVYQCSYKGCSYGAGSKNPYIQHIAFKHDEWYKRINRRIEQAMNDPEIGDELEELSAVKEVFVTDHRIMPIAKGSSNVKPLWVDGQATGRDAENEIIPPIKEANKDATEQETSDKEKPKEKNENPKDKIDTEPENKQEKNKKEPTENSQSGSNSPIEEDTFESMLKSQISLANVDTPETTPKKEDHKSKSENMEDLPIVPNLLSPKNTEEEMETETIVTFTGTLLDDPKSELRCQFCTKVMKIDPSKTNKNRQSYQIHLMESHFERSMYSDIPTLSKYFCPYKGCDYTGTDQKSRFRIHLAFRHKEFAKRINRRINELDRTTPSFEKSGELHNLRGLRDFFQKDSRVVNPAKTDAENWIKDDILFSAEVILKAGPPMKSKSNSPQSVSGSETPIFLTPDGKILTVEKQELDIPEIKVEISEELIKQLKHEPIKLEPVDLSESPMSTDGEKTEDTMPLISLKVSEEEKNANTDESSKEDVSRKLELNSDDKLEPTKEELNDKEQQESKKKLHPKLKGKGKKSKKEVKTQNLRKEPREENLQEEDEKSETKTKEVNKTEKKMLEKWDVNPKVDKQNSKDSLDDSYDELKEITESLSDHKQVVDNDSISIATEAPLTIDESDESNKTFFNDKTGILEHSNSLNLVLPESPASGNDVENDNSQEAPVKEIKTEIKTNSDDTPVKISAASPSLSLIQSDESESSGSKAVETPDIGHNPEIYACKTCKKEFDKRPGVIMHIITQHMQERFGDVPHLIEEKYKCHHNGCVYSSTKRNGLLAHLTLKHNAIKITDVTDLIIHNDEQLLRAVKTEPRTSSLSSESHLSTNDQTKADAVVAPLISAKQIKQECIEKPLPVRINKKDQADISWKCKECDRNFVNEDSVRQHILLTHLLDQFDEIAPRGLKIYSCKQCFKYSTVSRNNFIKHLGMLHQVVHEETVGQYVEQTKSLLLDIDVIKCRCDKQFDKQRQLKDHIVFSHYKHKFKHIPKGKERYSCKEFQCVFSTESRVLLIKHLVSTHKMLTEKDINKFIPSNGESQSSESSSSDEESLGQDDSSIDFNDSVSQAQTPKHTKEPLETNTIISQSETPSLAEMPFANNLSHKCPICSKLIAQRSNFEDHLQTHGIQHEAVFHCIDCEFATSFAQMYYHLSSFHKKSSQIDLQCLSCEENFNCTGYQEAVSSIRDHCTNKVTKSTHQFNAKRYIANAQQTLYFVFR